MKVTRDVIYDLLPAYFAGEVSDDTRALVDAYFVTDPEFARMATRFQSLIADRHREAAGTAAARERETFVCARRAAEWPQKTRAAALMWGFASLIAFGMAMLTWNDRMGWFHPGVLLGVCFGVASLLTFTLSYRIRPGSAERARLGV